MENLYDLLGVDKNANDKEIKKAYRNKSKEHHPDVGGNEDMFKKIVTAYEVLSDKEKRKYYDLTGSISDNRHSERRYNPFMGQYHNENQFIRVGSSIKINLKLTVKELFFGTTKKIKYKQYVSCSTCSGVGGVEITCDLCHGSGFETLIQETAFGTVQQMLTCRKCRGEGTILKDKCNDCGGNGVKLTETIKEISVPKGLTGGDVLSIPNDGHSVRKGNRPGDLYVVVVVEQDDEYTVDGTTLFKKYNICYTDLVMGTTVEIITLDNVKIKFNVLPGTENGKKYKLRSKGLFYRDTNIRGDLIVELNLKIPTTINNEIKDLLLKYKQLLNKFNH
jgi:molecular chaperone DnaJ